MIRAWSYMYKLIITDIHVIEHFDDLIQHDSNNTIDALLLMLL